MRWSIGPREEDCTIVSASPRLDRCVSAWSNARPRWTCFCKANSIRSSISPTTITCNISPGQIVTDVATGKIDVALVWGPVGTYFARRQAGSLLTEAFDDPADPRGRLAFPISFGVRSGDKERSARIERLMRERAAEIEAISAKTACRSSTTPFNARHGTSMSKASRVPPRNPSPKPPPMRTPRPLVLNELPRKRESSGSDKIDCNGTETMQDIQKLAGGSSERGTPYDVQGGKVDAKTYTGWLRFAAFCQSCHGTGGVGSAIAPDLTQALKSLDKRQFEKHRQLWPQGQFGEPASCRLGGTIPTSRRTSKIFGLSERARGWRTCSGPSTETQHVKMNRRARQRRFHGFQFQSWRRLP